MCHKKAINSQFANFQANWKSQNLIKYTYGCKFWLTLKCSIRYKVYFCPMTIKNEKRKYFTLIDASFYIHCQGKKRKETQMNLGNVVKNNQNLFLEKETDFIDFIIFAWTYWWVMTLWIWFQVYYGHNIKICLFGVCLTNLSFVIECRTFGLFFYYLYCKLLHKK